MTLYIGWLHKYKIAYQVTIGNISLDEYVTGISELQKMVAAAPSDGNPHLIMDVEKLASLPNLGDMRRPEVDDPDAWLIYINMNNALFKMMAMISTQLMKVSARVCKDYDEAFEVLKRLDTSFGNIEKPSLDEIDWQICIEGTDITPIHDTNLLMIKA